MIPFDYITEWRATAPWVLDAQVEQDLVLSRALVAIFQAPVPVNKVILAGNHLRGPARDARIDGKTSQRRRVLRQPLWPLRSSERRVTARALTE